LPFAQKNKLTSKLAELFNNSSSLGRKQLHLCISQNTITLQRGNFKEALFRDRPSNISAMTLSSFSISL
jgi:hypothetical protein